MSAAIGKRTNDERAHAAYMMGTATEEQIADMADMLLRTYDRQRVETRKETTERTCPKG